MRFLIHIALRRTRSMGAVLLLAGLAACGSPTGPALGTVQEYRAMWLSHHLTKYAFDFETTGYFNAFSGHLIHLVVLNDTVRSAVFVATGDSVPAPPATFATIDGLFNYAIAGVGDGSLTNIEADASLSYPRRLDFRGPPDASGSLLASNLQVLP